MTEPDVEKVSIDSIEPTPGRPCEDTARQAAGSLSSANSCVAADLKAHLIFWSIFAAGLILDIWSKHAVFDRLQRGPDKVPIIKGFLQLVLAENEGAVFGIAGGQYHLLVVVSVAALALIFAVFLFGGIRRRIVHIALALFAAGVCGNLRDRLFNDGRVRDFIDVVYWPGRHWPTFNVADTMLCIGVGLLMLWTFTAERSSQKRARPRK